MPAIHHRFSLSSLFLIAVAFAAYQSGRLKVAEYARTAHMAEADAAGLRDRNNELEQLARTWKNIALDSQLRAENSPATSRRWKLNTATIRGPDYAAKLDALGIKLLTISNARDLHLLSDFSTQMQVSPIDEFPTGCFVQGGGREQELLVQAGFREMPTDILMLLPTSLTEILETQERVRAKRMGLELSQIAETSFDIVQPYGAQARPVVVRSIRPSGQRPPSK